MRARGRLIRTFPLEIAINDRPGAFYNVSRGSRGAPRYCHPMRISASASNCSKKCRTIVVKIKFQNGHFLVDLVVFSKRIFGSHTLCGQLELWMYETDVTQSTL